MSRAGLLGAVQRLRGRGIELKTSGELEAMRAAGIVVARTLAQISKHARPGISTGELDELAEHSIRYAGAVPSFKGYHGFPASICASVNDQVVHGIPSRSQILRDGDLVSIDCGAILDGWHGDAAITLEIGSVDPESHQLSAACMAALDAGIAAAQPDGRLSDISYAIEQTTLAISTRDGRRYNIVANYGGHGIGTAMHMEPYLPNHGRPGRGPRLREGMVLAIEPMLALGTERTEELEDGWTVVTSDGSLAAHWEHTVAITAEGPWVLTAL
jgi:methionyl aminopeptidase